MPRQNIPELRQLGETKCRQKSLKTDEIRVMLIDVQAIHGEGVSQAAAAELFAERFSLLAANLHHRQEQQRQARKQEQGSQCGIENSLDKQGSCPDVAFFQGDQRHAINFSHVRVRNIKLIPMGHQANAHAQAAALRNNLLYFHAGLLLKHDDYILDLQLFKKL